MQHLGDILTDALIGLDPASYLALVAVVAIIAQWLAWRIKAPSILLLLVIGFVILFNLITRRTKLGLALIGMSEDREAAQLRGINVRRLAFGVFVLSGMVAGAVGLFVGPKTFAVATLGTALALKGFVVLAIGGFGSMSGTLIGGVVVGMVEASAARFLGSEFAALSVLAVLLVILMARPTGLFGSRQGRTV